MTQGGHPANLQLSTELGTRKRSYSSYGLFVIRTLPEHYVNLSLPDPDGGEQSLEHRFFRGRLGQVNNYQLLFACIGTPYAFALVKPSLKSQSQRKRMRCAAAMLGSSELTAPLREKRA